ncbi:unnamed protein product [Lepidochelys olivacea]
MSDPMLREKKFLKPVLHILEEKSHDRNSIVRQMAVRGLGNLVYGAPEKECRATFHLCVPFLGLKRLQTAVNEHRDGTAELKPEELEVDICRHLAKENAELLENLYKSTITYFCSSWEEIRGVAAKLAGIILEHTDRQRMKWLDLEHLPMDSPGPQERPKSLCPAGGN